MAGDAQFLELGMTLSLSRLRALACGRAGRLRLPFLRAARPKAAVVGAPQPRRRGG